MTLPQVHDIRRSAFGGWYVFTRIGNREYAIIVEKIR